MFDESQPPSPNQALVSLAPLEPEWQPIFQASNQVVLYNPTSHALSIHKSSSVPERARSPCPYCHRPFPPGYEFDESLSEMSGQERRYTRVPNYFQLLAISNQYSRPSTPPPPVSETSSSAFPREAMAEGYFKKFFQEERRLGMGANGSVYLCQHVLDSNALGHFAVKRIAIGHSHSYLLGKLREIRLLEKLRHRNIITYHHAWLESFQFSSFGPQVPTLHVLMQWAEGGSLDDFINLRLGQPSQSSPVSASHSARIQALRAIRQANPEKRERLRQQMEEGMRSGTAGQPSWKAVHLLSAEELKSLFSDIVEGLAFLHDRSILHLDLKPGNVLLTHDEGALIPRAMLSDFGTSRDMLQSSWPRSGNTGTLEYASPESLPSPRTGLLKEINSKSDMWSLGMILHKMIFFRLPYHYASDGDGSAKDETEKMDNLEQEILNYSGFRSTSPLSAAFDSRHLPRSFLILLETLLSVMPSSRPSCERILTAIREGRFDPVDLALDPSATSLVQVRRTSEQLESESDFDGSPVASATSEQSRHEDNDAVKVSYDPAENTPFLSLPSPPLANNTQRDRFRRFLINAYRVATFGATKDAWVRTTKACILALKAISIVLSLDVLRARPTLFGALVLVALSDPFSERLQVSLVLGLAHLLLMWVAGRAVITGPFVY